MADKAPRVAPQIVFDIAPGLGGFNEEILFGKVWPDPALAPRDRSLVTLSALVSLGRYGQVASHTGRALDNGVTPVEIGELLTQLAFYTGWPNAISAIYEVAKTYADRGIGPVSDGVEPALLPDAKAEVARRALIAGAVAPTAPALAADTDQVLFADLWLRPQLAPRDRSLVTMSALIALGQAEQLPFHVNRAMDNGLTAGQAGEVLRHIAYYAGWPRAISAVGVLRQILETRAAG